METVTVINIKQLVEESSKGALTTHNDHTIAIIDLPCGTIITDNEAVHRIAEAEDNIDILVHPNDEQFHIFPSSATITPLTALRQLAIAKGAVTQVTLPEYIKKFGSRIANNHNGLLNTIVELGGLKSNYSEE